MSCCNNTYDLGCKSYCSTISFGVSEFSGTLYVIASFGNIKHVQQITVASGEPITIDLSHFNENADYTLYLENTLGQRFSVTIDDVAYDCFTVRTEARAAAYEYIPQPETNSVLVLTGDGDAVYQDDTLIGVSVQLVFNDNVIRIPSDYIFDSVTGTLTFASDIDSGVVIQILYR
jgi:hypothetical protein